MASSNRNKTLDKRFNVPSVLTPEICCLLFNLEGGVVSTNRTVEEMTATDVDIREVRWRGSSSQCCFNNCWMELGATRGSIVPKASDSVRLLKVCANEAKMRFMLTCSCSEMKKEPAEHVHFALRLRSIFELLIGVYTATSQYLRDCVFQS